MGDYWLVLERVADCCSELVLDCVELHRSSEFLLKQHSWVHLVSPMSKTAGDPSFLVAPEAPVAELEDM